MSTNKDLIVKVKVPGFLWSKDVIIYRAKKKMQVDTQVPLHDKLNHLMHIKIYTESNVTGIKRYYFYAEGCIINETPWDLYYFRVLTKKEV